MSFSPEYIRLVLAENFEDATAHFLEHLMAVNYAHLIMLCESDIVPREAARAIRNALDRVDREAIRHTVYDGSYEDLSFYVDRLVAESQPEIAGRLQVARSRNDVGMTIYRMRLRELLLGVLEPVVALRRALIELAGRHHETVFAAHTHTQPAQPTTVAHYFLAVIEQLERDTARMLDVYRRTNVCPLGACAITGTGFPINRARTSDLLGFDAPTGNTYGSIAAVDYLLEGAGAVSTAAIGVGRFVQDLLFWCTHEVGYLRLPDELVQVSSIMPQKRNPVALEHARALLSKSAGELAAVTAAVHNTPFGDVVDTEDDLQPLIMAAFRDAARGMALVALAAGRAEIDVNRMRERAAQGWVTATELADTIVRDHGVAFTIAHAIATAVVRLRGERPDARVAELLTEAARQCSGPEIRMAPDDIERVLSPEHFIAIRVTPGGPAPGETRRAVAAARVLLASDEERLTQLRASLAAAAGRLRAAAQALT